MGASTALFAYMGAILGVLLKNIYGARLETITVFGILCWAYLWYEALI
jgi:hypothetical protein